MRSPLARISPIATLLLAALAGMAVVPTPEPAAAQDMQPSPIVVEMHDFSFSPDQIVVRVNEPVQFVLPNMGEQRHRFHIGGFGEEWRSETVSPADTMILDLTFTAAGVYELWCPFTTGGNHRELGMEGTLTVVNDDMMPSMP